MYNAQCLAHSKGDFNSIMKMKCNELKTPWIMSDINRCSKTLILFLFLVSFCPYSGRARGEVGRMWKYK